MKASARPPAVAVGLGAGLPRAAALAILLTLAGSAALLKARSYDLWWHLEAGEQILRTLSIPRADDFSFTSRGVPWVDHEWLFQVLLHLGYSVFGPVILTLMKAGCALAVAAIGYRCLTGEGLGRGAALGVTAIAILGARFRLAERPETFSLALAALVAALVLSLARRPERPARRLALVGGLVALWSNLHAGALVAPAIAGAVGAGAWLDAARARGTAREPARGGAINASIATLLSAVCLVLSPAGWRIYSVPAAIASALSPANLINPEWQAAGWSDFPLFFVALAVAGAGAVSPLMAASPSSCARAVLLLLTAALGMTSVRHIGVFFALLPLTAEAAAALRALTVRVAEAGGTAVAIGVTTWMALVPPAGATVGLGIDPARFPVKAADFIDAHMPEARLYNDVSFGGYMTWRGYPRRRVFIDGRNEVHAELLRDLSRSVDDGRLWPALLQRHEVDGAVVGYRPQPVPVRDAVTGRVGSSTFSELHFPVREWALVYWDDLAMVFVRRDGRYGDLAGKFEYRVFRPEAWRIGSAGGAEPVPDASVRDEILRKLAEDPECLLANEAASVYGLRGQLPARGPLPGRRPDGDTLEVRLAWEDRTGATASP